MKRNLTAILLIFSFFFLSLKYVEASEIDILVKKLVEKGILTEEEAKEVVAETKAEIKKEAAIAEKGKAEALPEWIQNTKLKGDFRLRYQYDHVKQTAANPGAADRNRGRIRLRLGIESKVNDKVVVAAGIATGVTGTTPDAQRSTNITFTDSFSKKSVILDYAYAQYTPFNWATIMGGKIKNPLWEPSNFIWDTDITPEGGAFQLNYPFKDLKLETFLYGGVFPLDENAGPDDDDPVFYAVQPGVVYAPWDNISIKGAFSYYNFSNVIRRTLDCSSGTNTTIPGTILLANDYATMFPALEVSFKDPLKSIGSYLPAHLSIPYFAAFAEYVYNPLKRQPTSDDRSGYIIGFKLGTEKITKWKDWQFRYNYAKLERDAIPDILPDMDRYGGRTGMKAHTGIFEFGVGKNTSLAVNYCYGEQLKGNFGSGQSRPTSLLQVDWNSKF
jgi:polyhydroxyalkanoate synthesis regulator phasin